VAKEAILALENNCVLANLIHRSFDAEYQKVGATILVRKPSTFQATAFSSTVAVQAVTESSVAVVLDTLLDTTVEITSQELTLDIVSFSKQVVQPVMRGFSQAVDALIAAEYDEIAGHTAVSGTPAVSDIANLVAQLDIQKVPWQNRRGVLHPITSAKYVPLDSFLNADKRGTALTIREAQLGRVMGLDWFVDQNITTHDSGIADVAGAFKGAAAAGATAATVDALTDAEIIAAGDVFKVVGSDKGYRIVTGGTVATNTQIITFSPALDSAILDDAVVTFQGDHKANMAFHPNWLTMATAPLEPPMGGAAWGQVSYNGLTCRVVFDYSTTNKKNTVSFDMLMGLKLLDKDLAARLCD
jgi:hypothetical protein